MISRIGYTPISKTSFGAKLNINGCTEGLSKDDKKSLKESATKIGTDKDTIDVYITVPASKHATTELAYNARINNQKASNYIDDGDSFDYVTVQTALDEIAEKEKRGEFL